MFVVIYLTASKKHIIVPENFILGLCEEKLKNYGANSNQTHLIFWSKAALFGVDEIPDSTYQVNFSLKPTNEYPPPANVIDTCYFGLIKRFFRKFFSHIDFCFKIKSLNIGFSL